MFEFIAHDKWCCKPDEVDRDVRHGQLLKTMMMMYVCMYSVYGLESLLQCGILVALPLVHAARHNDVKPLLGRELMILMYVCMYVCHSGVTYVD